MRRNDRALRLRLRIDQAEAGVIVTLPRQASEAHGLAFVRERATWILAHLENLPPRVPFVPGAVVPFLGVDHRIRHVGAVPAPVRRDDGAILVSGPTDGIGTRVLAWLRAAARSELEHRATACARTLGLRAGRITIRDTRSRWGSCSAAGNLSFSWRLILAPDHVLDYVVAHEVAHLLVPNHGPAFWATVSRLGGDVGPARAWLAAHGRMLLGYG